jgi:hypothetical protein
MHLWKEGDRSEAICHACEKRVGTHFAVRTYTLHDSGVDVPDVLVAVCDECGATVALPAQSAPKLKEARGRRMSEVLEARIPGQLDDVLHLLADHYSTAVAAFRADLLRFYLSEVLGDDGLLQRVNALARTELAQGRARARVSVRVPTDLLDAARRRARAGGITSDADLVRGIVIAAKEDVLEAADPRRADRLSGVAQAEGALRPAA